MSYGGMLLGSERVKLLETDLPKLVFASPLSKDTTCSLRVDGPFGAKEAVALLRLIQMQIEILSDGA